MTSRDLYRLLPLLALFCLATFLLPERPDDEAGYATLAERLVEGSYTTGDDAALLDAAAGYPDLWFGPGLPLVLAPLEALGVPVEAMRLVGPALLFLAVLVFFALVRLRCSAAVSLVAAYGLGLYLPLLTLLPNLHSEPLAIVLLVVALYTIARDAVRPRVAWLVVGAGALAGLALTRVAFGWVLTIGCAILLVWGLVARRPFLLRTAMTFLAALVLCLPWLAFTWTKTDRFPVWGTSGSLSLYWMASPFPGDLGDWRQADDVFTDPTLARHRPLFRSLRGLTLAEQTSALEEAALDNIREHPGAYLGNISANAARMLVNAPYRETSWSPRGLVFAVPNVLLLGLALLVGGRVAFARARLPPESVPFLVLGGTNVLLHLFVASYPRMLMPSAPVAVWLVAVGTVALAGSSYTWADRQERRRTGVGISSTVSRTSAIV